MSPSAIQSALIPSPDPSAGRERERIPVLDGLRGVAILMVLFAHLTPDIALPNRLFEWSRKLILAGWVGVDLFFVLSGFLITGILLEARGRPHYFRNFYTRRALRIFPLYYLALAAVFVVLPALGALRSAGFDRLASHQIWNWAYATNFGMWFHGRDAFISGDIAVSHFWSLAVEEHFYLLWPLLVLALSSRALARACIVGAAAALAIRSIAVLAFEAGPYFSLLSPSRVDALMVGCWISIQARDGGLERLRRPAWIVLITSSTVAGFFFLRMGGLWPTHRWTQTMGLSLMALLFGAALILTLLAPERRLVGRLLNAAPLAFFGKYSYGLYVIHGLLGGFFEEYLPVAGAIRWSGSPSVGVLLVVAARIAVSVLLALVSWHILEKHFLGLKKRFANGAKSGQGVPAARVIHDGTTG